MYKCRFFCFFFRLAILKSRNDDNSDHDGINSIKYQVLRIKKMKLYTWINVYVNEKEVLKVCLNILFL